MASQLASVYQQAVSDSCGSEAGSSAASEMADLLASGAGLLEGMGGRRGRIQGACAPTASLAEGGLCGHAARSLLILQSATCWSRLCSAGATTWSLQARSWLKAWKT